MTDAPLILAFDTSAAHCAAALLSGDRVLAVRLEEMARGQAERLFPLLEEVLAEAGAEWRDLSALGCGIGPGNFTGIRLSVASARGLALSLGIPAIGVSSLEAMAYGTDGVVVASLDARRDGLFVQVLGGGETREPLLCTLETLPPIPARAEPTCIGHRADAIAAFCGGHMGNAAMPRAVAIAHIANARRRNTNLPRPAPLYLKPADAAPSRDAAPVILE
jgi:tRNA threonylcarbamoyladenosine biosynthesis protein TsaB